MDKIRIVGGSTLNGVIPISGAKNAALPLMIASLLTRETLTLENMPLLADVTQLERILGNHGVDYTIAGKRSGETVDSGRTVHFNARNVVDTTELKATLGESGAVELGDYRPRFPAPGLYSIEYRVLSADR